MGFLLGNTVNNGFLRHFHDVLDAHVVFAKFLYYFGGYVTAPGVFTELYNKSNSPTAK